MLTRPLKRYVLKHEINGFKKRVTSFQLTSNCLDNKNIEIEPVCRFCEIHLTQTVPFALMF